MSFQYKLTDEEMYWLICGLDAGLKLKDLTLPEIDTNTVLHPIGVGGNATIGLTLPTLLYDGTNTTGLIPVSTHDVNIDYSGFSVNIKWDSERLQFDGVEVGDFGTISDGSEETDIRYQYADGVFKAIGLRDHSVVFSQPIILFYLRVTIIGEVTQDNPIPIKFVGSSYDNTNYTTLLTWVELTDGSWYNYYITPLVNINGQIISDIKAESGESNSSNTVKDTIGEDKEISAKASPSGVYVGSAFTAPGQRGVVPIYSNSNTSDNFPYNQVHCKVIVEDDVSMFNYINVVGAGGFSVKVVSTVLSSGYVELDIVATRDKILTDAVTFCYIDYQISINEDTYVIPLNNILSELINTEV